MPGLEDLYREVILDHYRSPRNRGKLKTPPAHCSEGFNPLCGDEIVVYVETDGDVVTDIRINGQGCSDQSGFGIDDDVSHQREVLRRDQTADASLQGDDVD